MLSRKSIIALGLVAVAAAYSGYWYYARSVTLQIIESWTEQRRAEGFTVAYDTPETGGYPLLVRATLGNPELRRDGIEWRGERLSIELQPWNFRQLRFDLHGAQRVVAQAGAAPVVMIPAEAAVVANLSPDGRLSDAALLVRDLTAADASGAQLLQATELWLEAKAPPEPPASHEDTSLTLSLSAADILLPEAADGPLGRTLSKLRADLQVRGAIAGAAPAEALERWRRAGGTIDVDWFQLAWGEFDLRAKGTIALDAEARPLGAFSTDIRGHNQALDALVSHSILKTGEAAMGKIALALLAKPPPEGGAPVLSIPVTAQDGGLYAGPLKILDLEPIPLR